MVGLGEKEKSSIVQSLDCSTSVQSSSEEEYSRVEHRPLPGSQTASEAHYVSGKERERIWKNTLDMEAASAATAVTAAQAEACRSPPRT